ncbi:protein DMR6-LIKE OXYGENASE 2 [Citrus sinensis]|uniref:Protein DMR6-LIKE OXYGENASE 2 n=1 Tax=Citrus sinensis TaxID=2711 RepID=A0ACB8HUA8_CITSI|nr:protein DMR6-LIKE OXYGENASE 2 [Citrus sinensis]
MAAATTKLLLSDLASTVKSVPSNYIRPISDRPNLTEVQISDGSIPLVDLQVLNGPSRLDIIKQIGQACQHDGFFQDYMHEWPSNPPSFRYNYVRGLVLRLPEAISESKHGQHMALNYCPPCPQPDLTYGLPGHTDPNLITVLLQDDVPGLQVLRNGKWLPVSPIPNTFIVNIGDQMQVLSNDLYKSVLHRALVNCDKERISIPRFYCPSPDAVIAPAKDLIDERHLAFYKNFTYAEYYQKFWNRGLAAEGCLDLFEVSTA